MMARPSPLTKDFEALVMKKLAEWHVPGVSIAVICDGAVFAEGYGIAKVPSTPVTPKTMFYMGSTTKAFLGAAWTKYIGSEENEARPAKIALDTPLCRIIPDDFVLADEYATAKVTIEDALSHRTGMAGYDLSYGGEINSARKVARNLRNLPLSWELRTRHQYCNSMYTTACHALETASSKPLGQYLREEMWNPLDMHSTCFSLDEAREIEQSGEVQLAEGYRWSAGNDEEDGKFIKEDYMVMPETDGAGGVISNVLDYAKWIQMLINQAPPLTKKMHREILFPKSIDTDNEPPWEGPLTYSLGWVLTMYQGHRIILHAGGLIAFGSQVIFFPDKNIGIVGAGNTRSTSNTVLKILLFSLLDDLLDVPLAQRFDFEAKNRASQKAQQELASKAKELLYPDAPEKALDPSLSREGYTGTYTHPGFQTIRFTLGESQNLILDLGNRTWRIPPARMEHVTGEFWIAYITIDEPAYEVPIKVEFRIGYNGAVLQVGLAMEPEQPESLHWFQKTG